MAKVNEPDRSVGNEPDKSNANEVLEMSLSKTINDNTIVYNGVSSNKEIVFGRLINRGLLSFTSVTNTVKYAYPGLTWSVVVLKAIMVTLYVVTISASRVALVITSACPGEVPLMTNASGGLFGSMDATTY